MAEPEIILVGDYLVVPKTSVGIEDGLHLRPAGLLHMISSDHLSLEAFLVRPENPEYRASTRSVLKMMKLNATKGSIVDIYVKNGEGAEDFARKLYLALTTPDLIEMSYVGFLSWVDALN